MAHMSQATALTEFLTTAGTYAQYAVVSESVLGLKPKSLSVAAERQQTEGAYIRICMQICT